MISFKFSLDLKFKRTETESKVTDLIKKGKVICKPAQECNNTLTSLLKYNYEKVDTGQSQYKKDNRNIREAIESHCRCTLHQAIKRYRVIPFSAGVYFL